MSSNQQAQPQSQPSPSVDRGTSFLRGVLAVIVGSLSIHILVSYGSLTIPFDRLALAFVLVAAIASTAFGLDDRSVLDGGVLAGFAGTAVLTMVLIGSGVGFIGFEFPDRELVFFEVLLAFGAGVIATRLD